MHATLPHLNVGRQIAKAVHELLKERLRSQQLQLKSFLPDTIWRQFTMLCSDPGRPLTSQMVIRFVDAVFTAFSKANRPGEAAGIFTAALQQFATPRDQVFAERADVMLAWSQYLPPGPAPLIANLQPLFGYWLEQVRGESGASYSVGRLSEGSDIENGLPILRYDGTAYDPAGYFKEQWRSTFVRYSDEENQLIYSYKSRATENGPREWDGTGCIYLRDDGEANLPTHGYFVDLQNGALAEKRVTMGLLTDELYSRASITLDDSSWAGIDRAIRKLVGYECSKNGSGRSQRGFRPA